MSNFSAYASHYLTAEQGQPLRGATSTTRRPPNQSLAHARPSSSSHFHLDPLLHSTFGHRSIDLYGSHADDGGDSTVADRSPADADALDDPFGVASASEPRARTSQQRASDDIPDIADEEDDDDVGDDVYQPRKSNRHWARRGLTEPTSPSVSASSSTGNRLRASRATNDDTPNASYIASQSGNARSDAYRDHSARAAEHLDPFLVEDDDDHDTRRSKQRRHDHGSPKATRGHAPSSSTDSSTSTRREDDPSWLASSPSSDKGKAKAVDPSEDSSVSYPHHQPTAKVRQPSIGSRSRGWLAHSIAASATGAAGTAQTPPSTSKAPSKQVRPSRAAYSIYEEEGEEAAFASDTASEEDEGDYADDQSDVDGETATSARRKQRLSNSASTIHYPQKMSAASFPKAPHDDFHRRVYSDSAPSGRGTGAGEESITLDTHNPPTAIGTDLTSWKPWAAGNNPRWREWKDQSALLLWLASIGITFLVAGGASLGAHSPSKPTTPATRPSPYYTLTRSLPLLVVLSAFSLVLALLNLALLRNLDRLGGGRYLRFALIATPTILLVGWTWAFAGSFFYQDEDWSGGLWSTVGLRFISLFPLAVAIFFSRLLYVKQRQLSRSLSVLSLSAKILSAHPTLLLLSMLHILVFLTLSIPFLTIFTRLFLIGHFSSSGSSSKDKEWITDSRARLLAWLTLACWIWTWAALRGVMRVVVSSTVSHWYFHGPPSKEEEEDEEQRLFTDSGRRAGRRAVDDVDDEDDDGDDGDIDAGAALVAAEHSSLLLPGDSIPRVPGNMPTEGAPTPTARGDEHLEHRNPTAKDIVRASFLRATGPSLGTILLSAILMALSRVLILLSLLARNLARLLSSPTVPTFLHPLAHLAYLVSGTGSLIKGVSDYTLIYAGITGQGFWKSSRRCGRILLRGGAKGVMEGLLISTILSLLTISLSFLAALAGFLFSAHQLHVPADAPLVGLLCGIVPYWTLRLGADVLANGADTLYLCYAIDSTTGGSASGDDAAAAAAAAEEEGAQAADADDDADHVAQEQRKEARQAFETPGTVRSGGTAFGFW